MKIRKMVICVTLAGGEFRCGADPYGDSDSDGNPDSDADADRGAEDHRHPGSGRKRHHD